MRPAALRALVTRRSSALINLSREARSLVRRPCFVCAAATRALPSAVRGPVERPPQLKDNPKLALDTLISGTKDNVPQGSLQLEEWRRLFYAGHTGDNEDTKKTAFLRARKFLVDKGFVEVTDDIYSIRDRGT